MMGRSLAIVLACLQSTTVTASVLQARSNTTDNSSAQPSDLQSCNGQAEFCSRKYSNITFVAAHNSPFVQPGNPAANQLLPVTDQLNDGIRMLQGQTHYNEESKTLSYCHTSCDLLDAGTAEGYFTTVAKWVQAHPNDVVTLLIGNGDYVNVGNYTAPLENSGLARWAYVPPKVPMSVADWPTLGEMLKMQKRIVIFMDYKANQTQVPYILDEFSQMWETPFSPTDRAFNCTSQRPPGLSQQAATERMYIANHNLNTQFSIGNTKVLVPNTALINETNAVTGFGSLGLMANNCSAQWPQPPNFLLVDFYNKGNVPGSVFQVAANFNNVTYNSSCCGTVDTGSSQPAASSLGKVVNGVIGAISGLFGGGH